MATINAELASYSEELARKRQVVAVNKLDVPEVRQRQQEIASALREAGIEPLFISAVTGEGVDALLDRVMAVLAEERAVAEETVTAQPVIELPAAGAALRHQTGRRHVRRRGRRSRTEWCRG